MSTIGDFFDAIRDAGMIPPQSIAPGEFVRFPGSGKTNGNSAGWAMLFEDGRGGVFGDWSRDFSDTWQANGNGSGSPEKDKEFWKKVSEGRKTAAAEREKKHAEAAAVALQTLKSAKAADSTHPYLQNKGINVHGKLKIEGDDLIVPILTDRKVSSLQRISPDGSKKFQKGGKTAGGYFSIGDLNAEEIIIAEGYATAASIYESTGCTSVVAFNSGNLPRVAEFVKKANPEATILIAGDNDENQTGQNAAREAAEAVGAKYVVPETVGTDFNDLSLKEGPAAVKKKIIGILRDTNKKIFARFGDLELTPPDWIVEDLIEAEATCSIFGPPSSYKSFAALDLAACIATGFDFHGHEIKKTGPVICVAGEGRRGIVRRLTAWSIRYDIDLKDAPLYISKRAIPFGSDQALGSVIPELDEIAETYGKPVLIIIDTLSRNIDGDENSSLDMPRFVKAVDDLRNRYGASVLIVHHSGHEMTERSRGHSSFKAALDFEFRMVKDSNSNKSRFEPTKIKDHELPDPLAFELCEVEIGINDEDGNPVKSAVLNATEYTAPEKKTKKQGKWKSAVYDIFLKELKRHQENVIASGRDVSEARVKIDAWRDACKEAKIPRNRFHDAKNSLCEEGTLTTDKDEIFIFLGENENLGVRPDVRPPPLKGGGGQDGRPTDSQTGQNRTETGQKPDTKSDAQKDEKIDNPGDFTPPPVDDPGFF